MVRLRSLACAAVALLGLSSTGCHRKHPPRYVDQPMDPGMPPPPAGQPPPPSTPPPGPPPATPPPGPPPVAASERVLNVTGAAHHLTRVTQDPVDEAAPALSPSGALLLFEARVSASGSVVQQTLVGIDPRTGSGRTSFTGSSSRSSAPVWLPDGQSFLFISNASGRPLIVRSLAAVPHAAIAPVIGGDAAPDVTHPTVSADGRRVAVEASLRGRSEILLANLDGAHVTTLVEGHRPSWSPEGKRVVFTRVVNDYSQIFVINAEGGREVQVTSDASDHDDPTWAPSGKVIVFNSNRGFGRQSGAWNLYAIRPDGSGLLQITDGNSDTGEPNWGNDGWIYFASNQAGGYDIWKLRPTAELEALGNQR
jgi:TolB protein